MANDNQQEERLLDSLFSQDTKSVKWYQRFTHLGYYAIHGVSVFFRHPLKKEKRDLEIIEKISTLLDTETSDENLNKSKQLAGLHRLVENTHARRRLERWSLRVIAIYLVIVFGIIICTYANIPLLKLPFLTIAPNIMIAILTTTTANIIGLGLIVLRGHFLAKDDEKEESDK